MGALTDGSKQMRKPSFRVSDSAVWRRGPHLFRPILVGAILASCVSPLTVNQAEGNEWQAQCDPTIDYAAKVETWKAENGPKLLSTVTNPELLERLLRLRDASQVVRTDPATLAQSMQADLRNTKALLSIVDEFGWPAADMVGTEGADAAFIVAQHTIDHAILRRFRDLVERAADEDRVPGHHFAFLFDRSQLNSGQQQVYGTQLSCDMQAGKLIPIPLKFPDRVDGLRAAADLYPLELYVCWTNQTSGHLCRLPAGDSTGTTN